MSTGHVQIQTFYFPWNLLCSNSSWNMAEGSLEVILPTIWTDEMESKDGKGQRREAREEKRRESQKKEDPGAQKGRKVEKHYVSQMIRGPGGRRVGWLSRRKSQLAR